MKDVENESNNKTKANQTKETARQKKCLWSTKQQGRHHRVVGVVAQVEEGRTEKEEGCVPQFGHWPFWFCRVLCYDQRWVVANHLVGCNLFEILVAFKGQHDTAVLLIHSLCFYDLSLSHLIVFVFYDFLVQRLPVTDRR